MTNLNVSFRVIWDLGARQNTTLRLLTIRRDLVRYSRVMGHTWWQSRILAAAQIAAFRFGVVAEQAELPRGDELAWNARRQRKRGKK